MATAQATLIFNVGGVIFYTDSLELQREVSAVATIAALYGVVRLGSAVGSLVTEEGLVGRLAGYATRLGQLDLEAEVALAEAEPGF